jgi:hypothetical protein
MFFLRNLKMKASKKKKIKKKNIKENSIQSNFSKLLKQLKNKIDSSSKLSILFAIM